MTEQQKDKLKYNNEIYSINGELLNEYLDENRIELVAPTSACWRGYYGTWEIIDNKLYLIELRAYLPGFKEVDLNYFFPNQDKVFAYWINGEVPLPTGIIKEYIHLPFGSTHDEYLYLNFKNGELIGTRIKRYD